MIAAGEQGRPPDRVVTAQRLLAVCVALVIAVTTSSSGQTPALNTPTDATRAFNSGQFDAVEGLLRSATDERSLVLRARAHIARGRYAEADLMEI